MNTAPTRIGLGIVVCYLVLDDRQRKQLVGAKPSPQGLAVCQYPNEEGVYLLACDQNWKPLTDTWCPTVLDALQQAELEHHGAIVAWFEPAI